MDLVNQFSLLKSKRFFPLFTIQALGAYNDNVFKSALGVLITFQLVADQHQAQFLISLAGAIFLLPYILFSALSGQLADKFNRAYLIRLIKLIEIVLIVTAIVGFYFENIPWLMAALFLMGTHSTFFGPIKYSILPDLLQPHELLGGNGIVESSTFISILFGTIVGTLGGATLTGAITVMSFSLVLAFIGWGSSFLLQPVTPADPKLKLNWNLLYEIARLLRYTSQQRILFRTVLLISWFWFIGFVFVTQFPMYTKANLGADEQVVTLFFIIFSLGIAVGALLCNRLLKGVVHTRFVPYGILGMSLFTLDMCWASTSFTQNPQTLLSLAEFQSYLAAWRIELDLFLLCIFGGLYIVPLYAVLQTEGLAAYRSRIISSNNIFGAVFMIAAALVLMLLSALKFSPVQIFIIIAIINGFVAFYAWTKAVPVKG